ncbi:MAG: AAA family ATPase [Bacteroidia bacterium]|nr:AAA family ATPase [Bacteroidia bacterium]
MIRRIHIRNFLSIPEASVSVTDVSLLIGPNNSGKSNLLHALELLGGLFSAPQHIPWNAAWAKRQSFQRNGDWISIGIEGEAAQGVWYYGLSFKPGQGNGVAFLEIAGVSSVQDLAELELTDPASLQMHFDRFQLNACESPFAQDALFRPGPQSDRRNFMIAYDSARPDAPVYEDSGSFRPGEMKSWEGFAWMHQAMQSLFRHLTVYYLFSRNFLGQREPKFADQLNQDGSNLVQFLFYLDQNYPQHFEALRRDLNWSLEDIVNVRTPLDQENKLTIKFFDRHGADFGIGEVSEGVKYFLAFLALIHQPDPPRILLLEEPENGIHPRRISQLLDYLRRLAVSRGIQIVLTSHSPVVLDQFEDTPEAVWVFDRDGGATQIRNLLRDILEPQERSYQPAADESAAGWWGQMLSEKWLSGVLNGVPND